MTPLGLQNVLDGFKQCHLKARYVTEKHQGKEEPEKGGVGDSGRENTPEMLGLPPTLP